MTQPGDPRSQGGTTNEHGIAKFSPDGESFVILLKHGNVDNNAIIFPEIFYYEAGNAGVMLGLCS